VQRRLQNVQDIDLQKSLIRKAIIFLGMKHRQEKLLERDL